jgi:hypothetical protein
VASALSTSIRNNPRTLLGSLLGSEPPKVCRVGNTGGTHGSHDQPPFRAPVASLKTAGLHADGGGLYLRVKPSGAKAWAFIFQWHGARKEMGLGAVTAVGLATARERAAEARRLIEEGTNPIDARKRPRAGRRSIWIGRFGSCPHRA